MINYKWAIEIKDRELEQVIHVTADRMEVTPPGHLVFQADGIVTHVQAYGSYRAATIISSVSPVEILKGE